MRLEDSLYSTIKAAILDGSFSPDAPMREVALSEQYGVSRTPVREALNRLMHDNLLERRGRGLYVRSVPLEDVLQIYELRILLEGEAAAQAAESRRQSDLIALEVLVERDKSLVDPSDEERTRTNLEFHEAVWAATNNRILTDILERLRTHLIHAPMSTLSTPGRWEASIAEHESLAEALGARDSARARAIAEEHMRTARDLRVRLLTQSQMSR